MINRCYSKNDISYPNYGGRGIGCAWKTFESFMSDMRESYLEHVKEHGERQTTLDRIDSKLGYSKENCRWATYRVQAMNKRTTKYVKDPVYIKCKEYNLSRSAFYMRIARGWSVDKALNTECKRRNKPKN